MLIRRITQLLAGLALFGFSIAVRIKAGLGISPWDIFHQGRPARLTGKSAPEWAQLSQSAFSCSSCGSH